MLCYACALRNATDLAATMARLMELHDAIAEIKSHYEGHKTVSKESPGSNPDVCRTFVLCLVSIQGKLRS